MHRKIRRFSSGRHRKTVVIFTLVAVICALSFVIYFFVIRENPQISLYKSRISELESRIEKGTQKIYVANCYIMEGTMLSPDMVTETYVLSESDGYITDADLGKKAAADIQKGTELTLSLLKNEDDINALMQVEYSSIYIPQNTEEADFVDVRIRYPDGSDYIIIAKKQIETLDESCKILTFMLDEKEILMMDSAEVDQSIYDGVLIYLTKYTEPALTTSSKPNYIPSLTSCELIQNQTYLNTSFTPADHEARIRLEESMKGFLSSSGSRVMTGRVTGNTDDSASKEKGGSLWD
ncbi:MAG: hypothetical protein IK007_05765 [Lachnospiraceae bacterium]|nr:hypothetical protein [Lachnospiraceae bacterium]